MDKNTKMLLGLGAVAVVGYLIYQNNKPKGFSNASGRGIFAPTGGVTNSTISRNAVKPKCKFGLYATYTTSPSGSVSTEFHDCKTGAVTGSSLGQVPWG